MRTEPVTFYSDGLRLAGSFFLPDKEAGGGPRLLLMPCSGFTGLCRIHPARFARYLTARGFTCFGFDYRGFADSEGPRGRVILEEQVRDIRAAAAFAAADPRVDAGRLVLLGWGMGAGLVLDAAREERGVIGLIAANGFYNGKRVQLAHRGEEGLQAFEDTVDRERSSRARSGEPQQADPFEIYPLDRTSRRYVDEVLRKTPGYEAGEISFELAESLLRWDAESAATKLSVPLLIAHGDQNHLHPPEEATALREAYSGPVETWWVEGGGHTEWMLDEDPRFQALGERIVTWLEEKFGGP